MDNQNTPFQPIPSAQPSPIVGSQQKPKGREGKVLLTISILLLVGGLGFLGYTYKKTNDSLKAQSQKLSAAYRTIGDFQKIIDANQAEKDFIAKENNVALSRSLCSGKSVLMSDVHLNDKFGVFRFLCAEMSAPIRIGAFKKINNGGYEFTYANGTAPSSLNQLPGYIYDTEPEFFKQYGAKRF